MSDPTLVSITGTIVDTVTLTGTIVDTVSIVATDNERGWYAPVRMYSDFAAAEAAGYRISDFPDVPMDSALVVTEVESAAQDFHLYANWEE